MSIGVGAIALPGDLAFMRSEDFTAATVTVGRSAVAGVLCVCEARRHLPHRAGVQQVTVGRGGGGVLLDCEVFAGATTNCKI